MLNYAFSAFNSGFRILKEQSWTIGLVLLAVFVLKDQLWKLKSRYLDGKSISSSSAQSSSREEEMRQARLRQQELLSERAEIAKAERKEKEKAEHELKLQRAQEKRQKELGTGRRLRDGASSNSDPNSFASSDAADGSGGGYNPMQPWTARSSGYRPQRRQVNRG